MLKSKTFLVCILSTFIALFTICNSYARQLTPTERTSYAQNNILFYVPCDTEADCGAADAVIDGDPEDSDSEDTPTPDLPPSSGASLIVDFAIKSSWPTADGKCRGTNNTYLNWNANNNDPESCRQTVTDFAKSYNKQDGSGFQDCGKFVGYVLRNTVDRNAETWGTIRQYNHFDSTPSKWLKVSTDGQEFPAAQLKPGDILVYGDPNGGSGAGHIKIYIGERTVKCGNSDCVVNTAEAHLNKRTPRLHKLPGGRTMYNSTTPYKVYRYIGT